ncbi:MAG: hypothetical protein ACI8ZB_001272 [Desulforhopalus sp.]|jgi:hypothetical protein
MDYFGSMYIDNELELGEKVQFIEKVRFEKDFYQETVDLLLQERLLQEQPKKNWIPAKSQIRHDLKNRFKKFIRPIIYAGVGFSCAMLVILSRSQVSIEQLYALNRFVIYQPAASQVELTGTFNDWQRLTMKQIGTSGYWELNIPLPAGEYRFAYILDGSKRIADPTHPAREKDDFGGENTVLKVGRSA